MNSEERKLLKLKFNDLHGNYIGKLSFEMLPRDLSVSMTNEYNHMSKYNDWEAVGDSIRKFHSAGGFIGSFRDPALWNEVPQFFISRNLNDGKVYLFKSGANGQSIVGVLVGDGGLLK
jgi:hypothetical protein